MKIVFFWYATPWIQVEAYSCFERTLLLIISCWLLAWLAHRSWILIWYSFKHRDVTWPYNESILIQLVASHYIDWATQYTTYLEFLQRHYVYHVLHLTHTFVLWRLSLELADVSNANIVYFIKQFSINWQLLLYNATSGTTTCSMFPWFLPLPLLPSKPQYMWLVYISAANCSEKTTGVNVPSTFFLWYSQIQRSRENVVRKFDSVFSQI
jgi:hypothetical protein